MNHENNQASIQLSRRRFLQGASCLAIGAAFPNLATAARKYSHQARNLAFDNLHTGEKLTLTYFENGRYVKDAIDEINHLLRDHRTGDQTAMDPALFDLLHGMRKHLGVNKPFQIISGYRSPATNAMLRKTTSGVATKSQHTLGKAVDIRMEGIDSRTIRKVAIAMQRGGVGYYPESNFVHVDTGRVRSW